MHICTKLFHSRFPTKVSVHSHLSPIRNHTITQFMCDE